MDFAVDEALLIEAKDKCNSTAGEIDGYITSIYTKIADMNEYWKGDSYTEFSSTCEQYRDSMNQLVNLLKAYAVLLNNVDAPRETLEAELKAAVES